ncbi:hypothetical protein G9C98_003767 [Cotesia typhae]|uniref:Uncharacterized protein n=1 Tax=Cotesia typhae TaxID=2053667 RepID=A0A8J5QX90_9HYME|nr:hypothetical protein G9C98_003767 [Cotesia typhae]
MMLFDYFFLFFFVIHAGKVLAELPPGVIPCSPSESPDAYDSCVLQQLMILTPQLVKGIPSLKLPPLDPLSLPSLIVDRNLDAIRVKANLSSVRVYGASNYEIDELRAKPNDLSVFLRLRIPYIHVKGNYEVKGNLLLISLNGNGAFKGNFTDAATSFFNSNPRLVLDIINPIIEETAASIGKALAARALGALTKDEILP